jgi:hypothetical protein
LAFAAVPVGHGSRPHLSGARKPPRICVRSCPRCSTSTRWRGEGIDVDRACAGVIDAVVHGRAPPGAADRRRAEQGVRRGLLLERVKQWPPRPGTDPGRPGSPRWSRPDQRPRKSALSPGQLERRGERAPSRSYRSAGPRRRSIGHAEGTCGGTHRRSLVGRRPPALPLLPVLPGRTSLGRPTNLASTRSPPVPAEPVPGHTRSLAPLIGPRFGPPDWPLRQRCRLELTPALQRLAAVVVAVALDGIAVHHDGRDDCWGGSR